MPEVRIASIPSAQDPVKVTDATGASRAPNVQAMAPEPTIVMRKVRSDKVTPPLDRHAPFAGPHAHIAQERIILFVAHVIRMLRCGETTGGYIPDEGQKRLFHAGAHAGVF